MERPSAARRILRAMAQILLIVGITELTLDAALWARRFFFGLRTREQAKKEVLWQGDDYLRGRLAPRQKDVQIGPGRASINSLGFRGPEPRGKPFRIVCLGDSVTFGWGVSKEEATYPALLDRALSRRDAEVFNAGMPRWNSCDLMDLYVTRISALRPQVLVVLAGWNDIGFEFAPFTTQSAPKTNGRILWQTAYDSTSVAFVTGGVLRRLGDLKKSREVLRAHEAGRDAIQWERLDEYDRILTTIIQLARRDGAQPVLVTLPHFLGPSIPEAQKQKLIPHLLAWPDLSYQGWWRVVTRTNREIRKVARARSVPLAECEHSVAPEHFTDIAHLDEEGNRQLAACVARTLSALVSPGGKPPADQAPGSALR